MIGIDICSISRFSNMKNLDKFLEKYKVAIVPGIAFGIDEYVRISFACSEETFIEALDRLDKFVQGILA